MSYLLCLEEDMIYFIYINVYYDSKNCVASLVLVDITT